MKRFFLGLFITTCLVNLNGQTDEVEPNLKAAAPDTTTGWSREGDFNVNFSQVSLSNWASGGLNSISTNSFLNYHIAYTKDSLSWENDFYLGFGIIRQGGESANWIKSDDRIDLSSKLGYYINEKVHFAALVNFRTQFAEGFETPAQLTRISNFMAPAFLIGAIGLDIKPHKKLSLFVAPVTSKSTFVLDDSLSAQGAFGVEVNERYRSEVGGYVKIRYSSELVKNVKYTGKLDLFSNYFNNPQNIDVNFENIFTMKVNEWLSANLMTHLIYDDDIKIAIDNNDDGVIDEQGPRLQLKQIFGAGLSVKF